MITYNKIVQLVSVALLALVGYQSAIMFWQNVPLTPNAHAALLKDSDIKKRAISPARSDASLVQSIINSQPFGKVEAQVEEKSEEVAIQAPETQLNYKLRGIYFSENTDLSSAIIETKRNEALSYQIGYELEKGIKLHDIQVEHVVLDRYGKFETLSLEKSKFNKKNAKSADLGFKRGSTNQQYNSVLKKYKNRFANNPLALAKKFRAIPVTENGVNIGFKLKALRGETLLKKLNVDKDAVFTSINGVSLAKPFEAIGALKQLQTAKQVDVTYLLNGVEQTRNFEL